MANEVECKVIDMTCAELRDVTYRAGHELSLKSRSARVDDQYWRTPSGKLVRFRNQTFFSDTCSCFGGRTDTEMDLTIKGAEENDGDKISERMEAIIKLNEYEKPGKVIEFFQALGAIKVCEIRKARTFFYNPVNARIHHDSFNYEDEVFEWVEVETDTRKELHEACFTLGLDKLRDRICNKSTLDLIREKTGAYI